MALHASGALTVVSLAHAGYIVVRCIARVRRTASYQGNEAASSEATPSEPWIDVPDLAHTHASPAAKGTTVE